jgi:hypothetical protein
MKNSTLIHRIALWLDKKYLSRKTRSAAARSAPKPSVVWLYSMIASSTAAATPTARVRSRPQNQPSATSTGTAPARIHFS